MTPKRKRENSEKNSREKQRVKRKKIFRAGYDDYTAGNHRKYPQKAGKNAEYLFSL